MLIGELLLIVGVAVLCTPWVWDEGYQQVAHVALGLLLLFIVLF